MVRSTVISLYFRVEYKCVSVLFSKLNSSDASHQFEFTG